MSQAGLGILFLVGFFGWFIAAFIFAANGLREGSLRVSRRQGTLEFRRRIGSRIFGVMLCVFFLTVGPLLYWAKVAAAAQRHQTPPALNSLDYLSWFVFLLMAGAFGALMLFITGPNDLFLDLDRRTYRFVSGWPVCPRVQTGPWEDMAGVYVKSFSSKGSQLKLVRIAWWEEKRDCPELGRFRREDDANALAEEMSASLRLPRVLPPPPGKTSVDPVSQCLPTPTVTHPYRPFQSTLFSEDIKPEKSQTDGNNDRRK